MRVFIALPLSDDCRRALADSCAALRASRPGLRRVRPEEMHVTLAFLGELDEEGLALALVAARSIRATGFGLSMDGLVAFPRRGNASALAARVTDGARESAALAAALEDALERAGAEAGRPFRPREARPYSPHVTLARAGRRGVALTAEELAAPVRAACRADGFVVYSSTLGPGGARYAALAEVALG